jgi:hypothetical protein
MNPDDELKTIELNELAILSRAKSLELEGRRKMSDSERILFSKLSNKYSSEGFLIFLKQDGFFKGYEEVKE